DSTEVDRLAHRRKQDAEWMALWEPALNRIYGSPPEEQPRRDPLADLPQLPKSPRTRRAIEREWANWQFWMAAGTLALAPHEQRRPHALPPLSRVARLLQIAMDFAHLALGSFDPNAAEEASRHDQAWADLKRIYGRHSPSSLTPEDPLLPSGVTTDAPPTSSHTPPSSPQPLSSAVSPVLKDAPVLKDTKRDLQPCELVIGPHGLLCLQPIEG